MADPMLTLSPGKVDTNSHSLLIGDDFDLTFHDPPSSPFVSHIEQEDQENIAPNARPMLPKSLVEVGDGMPQSASKIPTEKKLGLKERAGSANTSPVKNLMGEFEEAALNANMGSRLNPHKAAPAKQIATEQNEFAASSRSRKSPLPSKSSRAASDESAPRLSPFQNHTMEVSVTNPQHPSSSHKERLRDNEGLTVAISYMEAAHTESHQVITREALHGDGSENDLGFDNSDFIPDEPETTSADMDDTCFSTFSEMPGLDMTKFAVLKQSPTKSGPPDTTPRARAHITPSAVRRLERTPSPTPRRTFKENDTTNLLLDFTAQFESFSSSRRNSPARGRASPGKSTTEPNLRSYYQNQRSPAKGAPHVPATPSQGRQMLNLLDFELPPPPTPRSIPTVSIREMETSRSHFQSQISSLTASLSGREAEVESLSKAIADAEHRVGEALETVRDERSAREHAESQMIDWKKKGEEVQKLLRDVQSELARNDSERDDLLARLSEAERRAEDAENRSSELETKIIEAESKCVDMTTFINTEESDENKKIYSEIECQAAVAEKVNEVARDLHAAYKAKHEKKIKALKDNYQKKADERCKELRIQIIRLERQVEEAEKKRDNTFSKISPNKVDLSTAGPCETCGKDTKASLTTSTSSVGDIQRLEKQRAEIESLKAKLAGLQSELQCHRESHDKLLDDLEAERVEKGELVAAAEQMLAMCGEKMEELQQEDFRRSQMSAAPPTAPKPHAPAEQAMRNISFLAGSSTSSRPGSALGGGRPGSAVGDRLGTMGERGGSGPAKASGLRAPGGFGFQGGQALHRSTSGGKSRLLSNIERMGGGRVQE